MCNLSCMVKYINARFNMSGTFMVDFRINLAGLLKVIGWPFDFLIRAQLLAGDFNISPFHLVAVACQGLGARINIAQMMGDYNGHMMDENRVTILGTEYRL